MPDVTGPSPGDKHVPSYVHYPLNLNSPDTAYKSSFYCYRNGLYIMFNTIGGHLMSVLMLLWQPTLLLSTYFITCDSCGKQNDVDDDDDE